jgi:putative membrane protein insertion efficiency factor
MKQVILYVFGKMKIYFFLIKCYIFFTKHIPHRCRFIPTCSFYSYKAIKIHGIINGLYFTMKRLVRCNPFCDGGIDHVPHKKK